MSSTADKPNTDLTGLDRLGKNVAVSWGAYLCVLVVGFLIPRQISDSLGPASLGIWDLGWATVRYLALANVGIGGSVSRYVGLHRAAGDHVALVQSVTAISIIQNIIAAFAMVAAAIAAALIVHWIELPSAERATEAFWVLFLLCGSVAVRMVGNPAGGILAGCHRTDLQHGINAAMDILLAVLMVTTLSFGGGLISLALVVFGVSAVVTIFRMVMARIICPEAAFSFKEWRLKRGLKLLKFGGKSSISVAPDVLVFQAVTIFLTASAGPAAVAVLARGIALIRHCELLVRRTATLLVPITSSLIGMDKRDEARDMVFNIGGVGLALTLPMMLVLVFFGDVVLQIWMGDGYANQQMMWCLVAGTLLPVSQLGTTSVLAGMNAHGKVAIASLITSSVVLLAGAAAVEMGFWDWSIISAALLIGASWTLGKGVVIPIFLKLHFGISLVKYTLRSFVRPALMNVPLAGLMYLARQQFDADRWVVAAACVAIGGLLTLVIYWALLLPDSAKRVVRKKLRL
ncbi:MAG: hypothetical protein AAGA84_12610 [Pseudomonadota bacterium]